MRVTQGSINAGTLRGLQGSLGRVQTLQAQLSSGKRVSVPSDDPSAAAASMTYRSQQAADVQYLRNIDETSARLAVSDTTLTSISARLRDVRDLVVQAQNGALSADGHAALASQSAALKSEIVGLYNTTYLDRPVFGGTIPGQQAVDPSTGAYLGNDRAVTTRISRDATIRVDVKGTDAGADTLPALLDRITTGLGTPGGTTTADLGDLDAAMSQVLRALGDVGARTARVDAAKSTVDAQRLDLTSRISENEDVDLPATIMNLQAQQVGYQAALGASAKLLQTSLLDFLK